MESGVSLSPWCKGLPSMNPTPLGEAQKLARDVGCPTDDNTRMVTCLKTTNASRFIEVQPKVDVS